MKFDELDEGCGYSRRHTTIASCPTSTWSLAWTAAASHGSRRTCISSRRPSTLRFRDLMLDTVEAPDELRLQRRLRLHAERRDVVVVPATSDLFGRKLRKLNSVLAGDARAKFSLGLGSHRVASIAASAQLPTARRVVDYFRWRNEDAHRNALNAHCYWLLRKGWCWTKSAATQSLLGLSVAEKNELLFQHGINFNDVPELAEARHGVVLGGL